MSAPTTAAAPGPAPAADSGSLFEPITGTVIGDSSERVRVRPTSYAAHSVDLAGVRSQLTEGGSATIALPDPDGQLVEFAVSERSVMEPGLQAKHPEIRTYAGRPTDGSVGSVRVGVTPMGLFASVRGERSTWYIDPAFVERGETRHLSYFDSAVPESEQLAEELEPIPVPGADGPQSLGVASGPVTKKTFRFALLTDPSYAAYFGSANVTAEKAVLVNRVNQVYNDDLAIEFVLVENTDKLSLEGTEATMEDGPCGANPCFTQAELDDGCGGVLDRNTFVLGQLIGADNYDVGHIGLGINGGGVAYLGSVGGGSTKGGGCTGLPFPEGDFFAIDYVAHEVGHQMGANHTFNGTQGACAPPNRNETPYTTQVEPGSGSSVMAYAGICDQDDLQPHTDPYFSFVSIEEITATVADDSFTNDEQQVVNLNGFDGADAFTIRCAAPGCSTSDPVVNGLATYNNQTVADAVSQATGELVTAAEISDYDSGGFPAPLSTPSEDGFTVDFTLDSMGKDIPTLIIEPVAGSTFTDFTGVIIQGGQTTNEGFSTKPGNSNPKVVAPADKTIPTRTPFTLTGSGTDPNGNRLVYLWEQTDAGGAAGTGLVDNNKVEGPLFRVFGTRADVSLAESLQSPSPDINLATDNPSRTFPDLAQVLADNTNAETGTCPAPPPSPDPVPVPVVECYAEFLPTQQYAVSPTGGQLNFRLSARDRVVGAGGYAFDDVALTVSPTAGPFQVTSRGTSGAPVFGGASETVTWDVNGTNTAALATNVRILLSLDGGATFSRVLADSTPNDGSESVTLPEVSTSSARIKVEAVGNYFFDVNDANFAINNTAIVGGPANNTFVTTRRVTFTNSFTQPGANFECGLDGKTRACGATERVKFKPGTHVYSVAARDSSGRVDPTPAQRTFNSPHNDGQLKKNTKRWTRHKDKGSYRGAWTGTRVKGQVLSKKATGISKIALVVHTGKGYGRVAVFLGKKKLGTFKLKSRKRQKAVLIQVADFDRLRSGKVRIVTLDNKPVRIDGLGIFTKS